MRNICNDDGWRLMHRRFKNLQVDFQDLRDVTLAAGHSAITEARALPPSTKLAALDKAISYFQEHIPDILQQDPEYLRALISIDPALHAVCFGRMTTKQLEYDNYALAIYIANEVGIYAFDADPTFAASSVLLSPEFIAEYHRADEDGKLWRWLVENPLASSPYLAVRCIPWHAERVKDVRRRLTTANDVMLGAAQEFEEAIPSTPPPVNPTDGLLQGPSKPNVALTHIWYIIHCLAKKPYKPRYDSGHDYNHSDEAMSLGARFSLDWSTNALKQELVTCPNGRTYNLSLLVKHANWEYFKLDADTLKQLLHEHFSLEDPTKAQWVSRKPGSEGTTPTLSQELTSGIGSSTQEHPSLEPIYKAEADAVRQYTGDDTYEPWNKFLRGSGLPRDDDSTLEQQLLRILFALSCLNKNVDPLENPNDTPLYRSDIALDLPEDIKIARKQGGSIIRHDGFYSTSKLPSGKHNKLHRKILYSKIRRSNNKNISEVSKYRGEKEIAHVPCSLYVTGQSEDGRTVNVDLAYGLCSERKANDYWSELALATAFEHLRKPYQNDSGEVWYGIQRPLHALAHHVRVVTYADAVIDYFKEFALSQAFRDYCSKMTAEDKNIIKVLLAFSKTGRESEVSWKDDAKMYAEYNLASAENMANFMRDHMALSVDTIAGFEFICKNMGDPAFDSKGDEIVTEELKYIHHIADLAHKLDLCRVYDNKDFEDALEQYGGGDGKKELASSVVKQGLKQHSWMYHYLMKQATECLIATGDAVVIQHGKKKRHAREFKRNNSDLKSCLESCRAAIQRTHSHYANVTGYLLFQGSFLEELKLPDTLTLIRANAFSNCRTLKITIGYNTYQRFKNSIPKELIHKVIIPEGVVSLQDGAFDGCCNLKYLRLPDSLTSIGKNSFGNCSNLEELKLPAGLKSIGGHAFNGCSSLNELTLPDSLESIGGHAFNGCSSLNELTLPDSLESIGDLAFFGCSSLKITIGYNTYQRFKNSIPKKLIHKVIIPEGVVSLQDGAFDGCYNLKYLRLPDSLTSIGENAFGGCSKLEQLKLPAGLKSIGDLAFSRCLSLNELTLPDRLESIGDVAFYDCSKLEQLKLPAGLKSIGRGAFYDCSSINELTLPDSLESVGQLAFFGRSSHKITIGYNTYQRLKNSIPKESIHKVIIPEGVVSLQDGAFDGFYNLKYLRLPDSLTSIRKNAFDHFPNLKITIGYNTYQRFKNSIPKGLIYRVISSNQSSFFSNEEKNHNRNCDDGSSLLLPFYKCLSNYILP